jgi:hypothetical protein
MQYTVLLRDRLAQCNPVNYRVIRFAAKRQHLLALKSAPDGGGSETQLSNESEAFAYIA